jgi:NAD(P)-dependent dehydrogenase (short-subunit alcohol dehydrogenase family)
MSEAAAATGSEVAIVVGAGPGLGEALVLRFAAVGMRVAAVSRRGLVPEWSGERGRIRGYAADATIAGQVTTTFSQIAAEFGPPDLVVFNVGTWDRAAILDISEELFERAWRTGCLAGFLTGQAAAAAMLPRGKGTIIFTGATGSIRGSAGFAAFAVPKFGLRALAQSMARELGRKGIHVAHVIVDGMIDNSGDAESTKTLGPTAIAAVYEAVHRQPCSAWTHELDLRPADENF